MVMASFKGIERVEGRSGGRGARVGVDEWVEGEGWGERERGRGRCGEEIREENKSLGGR